MTLFTNLTLNEQASLSGGTTTYKTTTAKGGKAIAVNKGTNVAVLSGNGVVVGGGTATGGNTSSDAIANGGSATANA